MNDNSDNRLDKLFDYTKFHIGIYITSAGALLAAYGTDIEQVVSPKLGDHIHVMQGAILSMFIAGMAGGIIASSCTINRTFDDVWHKAIGPLGFKIIPGKYWASLEHIAFWASVILVGYALAWK